MEIGPISAGIILLCITALKYICIDILQISRIMAVGISIGLMFTFIVIHKKGNDNKIKFL